jgi:adenylate cyclase
MPRKLAAILSADVAGYSRLMGDDEEATIRTLAAYHGVMRHLIRQHRGRVVDSPGDNMLAEFASVVDAVRGAVEIQRELHTRNAELPSTRQMALRIGINLGDVLVDGEKLYGDGVNIAARLEALAEPGGICISGTAYDQVENKLALGYKYVGEQVVKNIAKPVRVYRVQEVPRIPTAPTVEKRRNIAPRYQRWAVWAVAALLLLGGGIWAIQGLFSGIHDSLVTLISERSLPLPNRPSIVVLPFTNMSGDPQQE